MVVVEVVLFQAADIENADAALPVSRPVSQRN
jgi:hypothetical protein